MGSDFPAALPGTGRAPLLVLDTNAVLDWLVFRDTGCGHLVHSVPQGLVVWVATPDMRHELERVLARGDLDVWEPDAAAVWSAWDRWATMVEAPAVSPAAAPVCADPDDQKFIDLGLHVRAAALLSRDRAVLRCAPHARRLGLNILTPRDWSRWSNC